METEVRLDVITDIGVFVLTSKLGGFSEYDDSTKGDFSDVDALLDNLREAVKRGSCFDGWAPYQNTSTDQIDSISIEASAIKAFRLYYLDQVGVEGFNADATPTPNTTYPFTCNGEYLGNKLRIVGAAFKTPTTEYLLPIFVNDKPATDYMKVAALSQQIQLCKEADGIAPTEYLIIIPDVWLEPVAAADYLTDYVREAEPMTEINGGSKAKAWSGWSE